MDNKGVIIQGSARSIGNTNQVVQLFIEKTGFDFVNLNEYKIGQFDYEFKNTGDDFLPLMKTIIEKYDTIVFASPVYWYSMSGIMKAFFDRISDLLKIEKDLGRKLRGMNMALISCSEEPVLVKGFTMPFYESANYLGLKYLGDMHIWLENGVVPEILDDKINKFSDELSNSIG